MKHLFITQHPCICFKWSDIPNVASLNSWFFAEAIKHSRNPGLVFWSGLDSRTPVPFNDPHQVLDKWTGLKCPLPSSQVPNVVPVHGKLDVPSISPFL